MLVSMYECIHTCQCVNSCPSKYGKLDTASLEPFLKGFLRSFIAERQPVDLVQKALSSPI